MICHTFIYSIDLHIIIIIIIFSLQDNSRTAQVEQTIVITERGAEILTQ